MALTRLLTYRITRMRQLLNALASGEYSRHEDTIVGALHLQVEAMAHIAESMDADDSTRQRFASQEQERMTQESPLDLILGTPPASPAESSDPIAISPRARRDD